MKGDVFLKNDRLSLSVRPAWGGRVVDLKCSDGRDILVPVTQTKFDPQRWPKAGAFPLIPYHGRIRNAQFCGYDNMVQLEAHPDSAPHSLHGNASRLRWDISSQSDALLELAVTTNADEHWPWTYHAIQIFELKENQLHITQCITNCGESNMPAGLGWHPYFVKARSAEIIAKREWNYDEDLLPTGEDKSFDSEVLGKLVFLENWQTVSLNLENGIWISLSASNYFNHLVWFDQMMNYTCVEPVSHLANHIHCISDANPSLYCSNLRAGESITGKICIGVLS